MGKYMMEFDVGNKIEDSNDGMVAEILQKYDNGNVRFKVISVESNYTGDLEVGKIYYIYNCDNSDSWSLFEPEIISPVSIKELEKNIEKEEVNLNQFVENTRKNISDMKKNLELLKKTAIKIPTILIGEMYSYNKSNGIDIVGVCTKHDTDDNSHKIVYMDYILANFDYEWVYDNDFEKGNITNFKHLNSPEQKKIAAGFYAMVTGNIPGV